MMRWLSLLCAFTTAANAQRTVAVLDRVSFGPYATGFRVEPIGDAEGRRVHIWYPAAGAQRDCLTLAHYLGFEGGGANLGAARERLAAAFGSIDDDRWSSLTSQRVRACESADPATDRHPVLIGMFGNGTWPIHGEYFASYGYVVALITNAPGGRPPPGDMTPFVATQIDRQAKSLEALAAYIGGKPWADTTRLGVLGQAPSTFLFAIRNSARVDAISLQDSDIFSPGLSPNALRLAPGWRPSDLRSPFLHVINDGSLAGETLREDLAEMRASVRYRFILSAPYTGHEDLTGTGYAMRRVLGVDSALVLAFESMLRVQHAFFDAHLRDARDRRAVLEESPHTLVAPDIGRIQLIAAGTR